MKRTLLCIALLFPALIANRATTVIPPSFDELVNEADVIFQGRVTNVKSQWIGEGAQRTIVTYVTFRVEDAVKGIPGQSYAIRMLGGTVDGKTMEVADAPKFAVGGQDVVFVQNNGSQFIPLVGIMHGRFRVQHDQAGQEVIRTNDGKPVVDLAQIGRAEQPTTSGTGMSLADFKSAIRAKLETLRKNTP